MPFFVMVRLRCVDTVRLFCDGKSTYVSTLCEFAYYTFYVQRTAVNKDLCDCAWRARSLGCSQVITIAF